jgi:hypothetical protein
MEFRMSFWSWLFGRNEEQERKIDKAVDMSFPASDPISTGSATSTEPPTRPTDRKAPIISKEDIEQAQRGGGHGQS